MVAVEKSTGGSPSMVATPTIVVALVAISTSVASTFFPQFAVGTSEPCADFVDQVDGDSCFHTRCPLADLLSQPAFDRSHPW